MMTCNADREEMAFRCLLALVTVTALAVPYVALAAGQSFSRSGSTGCVGGLHSPTILLRLYGAFLVVIMDSDDPAGCHYSSSTQPAPTLGQA